MTFLDLILRSKNISYHIPELMDVSTFKKTWMKITNNYVVEFQETFDDKNSYCGSMKISGVLSFFLKSPKRRV
jgi:hypothetical protein